MKGENNMGMIKDLIMWFKYQRLRWELRNVDTSEFKKKIFDSKRSKNKGMSSFMIVVLHIVLFITVISLLIWWVKNMDIPWETQSFELETEPEKDLIDMTCEELEQKLRDTGIVSWRTEIITLMILKKCNVDTEFNEAQLEEFRKIKNFWYKEGEHICDSQQAFLDFYCEGY